jgi:hypothetical protein
MTRCARLAVLFLVLIGGCVPVAAQDIYQVNLAEAESDGAAYLVVFSSYGESISGHMNVGWGKESPALLSSVDEGCFGFYSPQTWAQFTLTLVEGYLRSCPSGEAGLVRRFIVRVSLANYDSSLRVMLHWRKQTKYQLYKSDCVTFAAEVANAAGLKVPERSLLPPKNVFPDQFLTSLIRLNGGEKAR